MMSAPLARTSSGRIALTVAAVPTGMKAGVRVSPCCMAMTPVRPAPSVAEMLKANRLTSALLAAAAGDALERDSLWRAGARQLTSVPGRATQAHDHAFGAVRKDWLFSALRLAALRPRVDVRARARAHPHMVAGRQ